jgi:hypothetical protein
MKKKNFNYAFSNKRMEKYIRRYPKGNKALILYQANIELSEALYPTLAVLEVALRNAVHRVMTARFGQEDWFGQLAAIPGLNNLNPYILKASQLIVARKEQLSPSKIVAELTLGFWVKLFNATYERILWKNIKFAFLYLPKAQKLRNRVAPPLNRFRQLRNRISHHEPICWNLTKLKNLHDELVQVIGWINPSLPPWLATFDRFDEVYTDTMTKLR